MRIVLILLLLAGPASVAIAQSSTFDISSYGAIGDGRVMNTSFIQRAIDAAAAAGGGVVKIPPGRWLTGVIELRSGVELRLADSAVLLGSARRTDYGGVKAAALISATGQHGIAITGKGVIDGQGRELVQDVFRMLNAGLLFDPEWQHENPWHQKRPTEGNRAGLIDLTNCDDVRINGVKLKDAASWVQTYKECRHLTIENERVESTAYWNNDGIDIVDCQDVRITGCQVNADDDGICLKSSNPASRCERVVIEHCTVRSSASGIKFGTASFGGFKDVVIRDITVYDTYRSAIALESVDGGLIEDIRVEGVVARNTGNGIFIRLGHRNQQAPVGRVHRVMVKDVTVEVPAGKPDKGYETEGPELRYPHNIFPASIAGLPGHPVEDVLLDNIKIVYESADDRSAGRYGLDSLASVPENESGYPEFSMFGELPAWGLYVRHASGLQLRQLTLSKQQGSFRPAAIFDDVRQVDMEGLHVKTDQAAPVLVLKNVEGMKWKGKDRLADKLVRKI